MQLIDIVRNVPYLFIEDIEDFRWIFFPICVKDHWVLYAVDKNETKIKYYNSLAPVGEDRFKHVMNDTFDWIKSFMTWCFDKNCVLLIIICLETFF